MKVANLVGSRFKEKPSDCVIDSHALMIRGGYMKFVGNSEKIPFPTNLGIYQLEFCAFCIGISLCLCI